MKIDSTGANIGILRAAEGMRRNADGMAEAAEDVAATAGVSSVRDATSALDHGPAVVSQIRSAVPDLDDSMVDLKQHEMGYKANARVVQTSDEAIQSVLDMVLPSGKED